MLEGWGWVGGMLFSCSKVRTPSAISPLDDNMESNSQSERSKDVLCLRRGAGLRCRFQLDFEVSICNSEDKTRLLHIYDIICSDLHLLRFLCTDHLTQKR